MPTVDYTALVGQMVRVWSLPGSWHAMPARMIRIEGRHAIVQTGNHRGHLRVKLEQVRAWKKGAEIDRQHREARARKG